MEVSTGSPTKKKLAASFNIYEDATAEAHKVRHHILTTLAFADNSATASSKAYGQRAAHATHHFQIREHDAEISIRGILHAPCLTHIC